MARSLRLSLYLAAHAGDIRGGSTLDTPVARQNSGRATEPRPEGPIIWFHTGDDETGAAPRELARRMMLERADLSFLFTTNASTPRASEPQFISQYRPAEALGAIRRFLKYWRPVAAVWTEPDLRPALLAETAAHDIPLYLIDAGTGSANTISGWPRRLSSDLLGMFEHFTTANYASASILRKLGAPAGKVEAIGNLEESASAPPCNDADLAELSGLLEARPTWLATGVTSEELQDVLAAHRRGQRRSHRLLLILVPSDLALAAQWAVELKDLGFNTARRSAGEEPESNVQIYIADTSDEMGLWYRLAPISFMGGTLSGHEGMNPLEAASLGSAVIHGPHIGQHRSDYERLHTAGASQLVQNGDELNQSVETLLSPVRAAEMAQKAWEVTSAGAAVTDRALDLLLTELAAH